MTLLTIPVREAPHTKWWDTVDLDRVPADRVCESAWQLRLWPSRFWLVWREHRTYDWSQYVPSHAERIEDKLDEVLQILRER